MHFSFIILQIIDNNCFILLIIIIFKRAFKSISFSKIICLQNLLFQICCTSYIPLQFIHLHQSLSQLFPPLQHFNPFILRFLLKPSSFKPKCLKIKFQKVTLFCAILFKTWAWLSYWCILSVLWSARLFFSRISHENLGTFSLRLTILLLFFVVPIR